MEAKEIAKTILEQLGGNKFIVMTGAKNLAFEGASEKQRGALSFKIGRNASSVNYVVIRLNGLDLYDMEFIRIRKMTLTKVKEFKNIYCDQLQELFTEVTGMYTSL